MSAKEQRARQEPEQEPQEAAGQADGNGREADAAEAGPEAGAASAETDQAQAPAVEDLQAEIAELEERLKRAVAETENVRRRAERERQDAVKYAAAPLAKEILGVADNLRRAIDSVPSDQAESNEAVKNLLSGVAMTESELLGALKKHGIEQIAVQQGDRFDPHQHEAMFEVPTDDQAPGTVVHILQHGYKLHDRLLRPARVGVAKAAGGGDGYGGKTGNGSGENVDTSA